MAIDPNHDRVIRPPAGIDAWSENLFFLPFDAEREIGMAMHLGRSGQDPAFWREFVHVYLPDGQALVAKSFGRASDTPDRVGANALVYECLEPFRRWRATFDGMARRVPRDELMAGVSVEGPYVRTFFELEFECLFDTPWQAHTDIGPKTGGAFDGPGSFHYEQVCRARGALTIGAETVELDARGFRDHTRGVRRFTRRSGHTLLSGSFPDGTCLGFYQVRDIDGTPKFSQGFVLENGLPQDVEVIKAPHFTHRSVPPEFEAVLRTAAGRELVVEGSPVTSTPMTIISPNDMLHGISLAPADFSCLLSPSRLRLGDVGGVGHLELSALNQLVDAG